MKDIQQTSVMIVGGGPVGLSMAMLLDRFGIGCIVAERSAATTEHPKARGCWVRTMEIFRQWGVEAPIRNRGLKNDSDTFAIMQTVAGHEYGRSRPEPNREQTPAWKSVVAQDAIEEEIFKKLQGARNVRIWFNTEVLSFEETNDGVLVRTRSMDTGEETECRATYLIAADGAASTMRRAAGVEMIGPATLAVMSNDYWKGDLSSLGGVAQDAAGFFLVPEHAGEPRVTILNTNGRDRWLTVMKIGGTKDDRERPWTDSEFAEMTRRHVGLPDLDVSVINRSIWRVSMQIAETFRKGRVFIAGDAAHRFPPTGGFGMNTGVQDAHNLAWKLAFVLKGLASDRLLDTYSSERRTVAQSNANFSLGNHHRFDAIEEAVRSKNQDRIQFWVDDMDNHTHSIGQNLGLSYEGSAVIGDGTVAPAHNPRYYTPSDRPGALPASVARSRAQDVDAGLVRPGFRRCHRATRWRMVGGGSYGVEEDRHSART
ncbi:FAD-dependent monooxygenase [Bradyrhizobium prioriisuperbiae]|uniref:FAD-dependent monooxygenase n=1 Tax=Bradyrhizobium prioriisuperbiae TaxID=2854389 RepID=UPI0028E6DAA5|nr:FAD-dependent monooxygenase [Bradyrhizobium prioritasuperba]